LWEVVSFPLFPLQILTLASGVAAQLMEHSPRRFALSSLSHFFQEVFEQVSRWSFFRKQNVEFFFGGINRVRLRQFLQGPRAQLGPPLYLFLFSGLQNHF